MPTSRGGPLFLLLDAVYLLDGPPGGEHRALVVRLLAPLDPQLFEAHPDEVGDLTEPGEDGHAAHPQGAPYHVVRVRDQDQDDAFAERGLGVTDPDEPLAALARDAAQNLPVMAHLEVRTDDLQDPRDRQKQYHVSDPTHLSL